MPGELVIFSLLIFFLFPSMLAALINSSTNNSNVSVTFSLFLGDVSINKILLLLANSSPSS